MPAKGLENIAQLAATQRKEVFELAAQQRGMQATAIEKDFWICWVLGRLFSDEDFASKVLFKGGTSLSKCYGLIERFSEDIDLILDWQLLTDEDPYTKRSNTAQDKFNKSMEQKARNYVAETLMPQVMEILGEGWMVNRDTSKPRSLLLKYTKVFDQQYLKPEIELEFGPMSAMVPSKAFSIQPYCATVAEPLFGACDASLTAIEAHKTFWDKITILHVEAHRAEHKQQPSRYSRHYYDIYQMLNSDVKAHALKDLALLNSVIEFKNQFYPQPWANYAGALAGDLQLVPPPFKQKLLEQDYQQMDEMIFGNKPAFSDILQAVEQFEAELGEAWNADK